MKLKWKCLTKEGGWGCRYLSENAEAAASCGVGICCRMARGLQQIDGITGKENDSHDSWVKLCSSCVVPPLFSLPVPCLIGYLLRLSLTLLKRLSVSVFSPDYRPPHATGDSTYPSKASSVWQTLLMLTYFFSPPSPWWISPALPITGPRLTLCITTSESRLRLFDKYHSVCLLVFLRLSSAWLLTTSLRCWICM